MRPAEQLAELERGATTAQALAFFDALPPADVPAILGVWRGSGLRTGHPQDGLLEALGWFGKRFDGADDAHPLLFGPAGHVVDVDSRLLPFALTRWRGAGPLLGGLFRLVRPLLSTRRPRARLRAILHRGQVTAAMIYDYLPIIDVFRAVDGDTLLGLMDQRGAAQPLFFVLRRA